MCSLPRVLCTLHNFVRRRVLAVAIMSYSTGRPTILSTMAIRSPLPDISIPRVSLPELILNKVESFAEKIAFIDDVTGRTMTFGEFTTDVNQLARSLHAIGLDKDDVIAVCLPNTMEYAVILYGVLLNGGTIVGIMKQVFDSANPRYVFTSSSLYDRMRTASSSCSRLQEIFTTKGHVDGARSYDELLAFGGLRELPQDKVDPEDGAAVLVYAGGSTGQRRGVIITHHNLVSNVLQISSARVSPFSGHDVTVAIRPAAHSYGLLMHFAAGLYNGCTAVFLNDYDSRSLLKAVEKYKVTLLGLTPLEVSKLAKSPDVSSFDVSSLKTVLCSGSPLSQNVLDRFKAVFKIKDVRNVFGMLEFTCAFMPEVNKQPRGLGVPLPNIQIKILDVITGEPLGPGRKGELWLKSPSLVKGYKDESENDVKNFIDGWFKTGDLAYYDNNINVYIVDRLEECIISGINVFTPQEIEDIILDIPGVAAVAVVGTPDDDYYQLAKAFVVRQPGCSLREEDIVSTVRASLDTTKWLHGGVEFVESLPTDSDGKVLRRVVKEDILRKTKRNN